MKITDAGCGPLLLVIALGVPAAGCSSKKGDGDSSASAKPDAHAELRAKVKKKMAALAALSDKASSAPQATEDASKPLSLKPEQYFVVEPEYLKDPHHRSKKTDDSPYFSESVLSLCEYATAGTLPPKDDDGQYLKKCDGWEYVAVMRPRKWVKPEVDMASKTFRAGEYEGDMLVYKIESGELLGSYVIHTTSTNSFNAEGSNPEQLKKDAEGMAKAGITVNIDTMRKKFVEGK